MLRGDLFWDSRCSIRVGFCWFRIMKKERTKEGRRKERKREERKKEGKEKKREGRKERKA